MMPVTAGQKSTRNQIFGYSWIMAASALAPWVLGFAGKIYGFTSLVLNIVFVALAFTVWRNTAVDAADMKPEKRLFGWSILYLFILFGALALDRMVLA